MAAELGAWLAAIGLEHHAAAFAKHDIGLDILPDLSDADLKEIGLSLGDRRRLLKALADMPPAPVPPAADEPQQTPARRVAAERRQLTVLFCDLVGSTSLSARIDPEDLRDLMRRYQDAVVGAVTRYGGYVANFLGDGVVVYFGWPRASEDQAAQAVRSGFACLEAAAAISDDLGRPLQCRIGIATGQVVVGHLDGAVSSQANAVSGETPNLAARLQALAAPGQLIIDQLTRRIVGSSFELDDLGAHALKGLTGPVSAWLVRREISLDSRFEARGATATPIVGREQEIGLLLDRWQQARAGEGQVVLLSGEAGIGKSRLSQALRERIGPEPHTRLRYQCSPYHQNSALYPITQHLQHAAGFLPEDDGADRLDRLEALLSATSADVRQDAALLALLLGLPGESRYGAVTLAPHMRKSRTFQVLLDHLLALAAGQPTLFLFEDAHWIDPTSEELLSEVVASIATAPILLLVTFRPGFHPAWAAYPHVTSLTLNRLPRSHSAEIVRRLAGCYVPDVAIERIVERTDGVPLYIEELTKSLIESHLSTADANIPASLQASLMTRLDRLNDARETAQIAAVIGRQFTADLLTAASRRPLAETNEHLDRLVSSELVIRSAAGPAARYTFKHALIQDAAYDSLLRELRRSIHERVADVLAADYPSVVANQPELLAQHYTNAGLPQKAIPYWLRAGRQLTKACAIEEAIAHLTTGLRLISTLSDKRTRVELELELRAALGAAYGISRDYRRDEVEENYKSIEQICGDIADSPSLVPAIFTVLQYRINRGNIAPAEGHANRLLRLSEMTGDPFITQFAWVRYAQLKTHSAQYDVALSALKVMKFDRDVSKRLVRIREFGVDPFSFTAMYVALISMMTGDVDQAMRSATLSIDMGREADNAAALSAPLAIGCSIANYIGNWNDAIAWSEECLSLSKATGLLLFQGMAATIRGSAWIASGANHKEAVAESRDGLRLMQEARYMLGLPCAWHAVARAELLFGEAEAAVSSCEEGLSCGASTGEVWFNADLMAVRGASLAKLQRLEDAEKSYLSGLQIAQQQGARLAALRSATGIARLWSQQGKKCEARDILFPYYFLVEEHKQLPSFQEAEELLGSIGN